MEGGKGGREGWGRKRERIEEKKRGGRKVKKRRKKKG